MTPTLAHAQAQEAAGDYAAALAAYTQLLSRPAPPLAAYEGKARSLYFLKQFQQAALAAKAITQQAPEALLGHQLLGLCFAALGHLVQAVTCFDQALLRAPDAAELWNERGSALLHLGMVEEALASYDRAIAANGAIAILYNNRAGAYQQLHRLPEALADYTQALALDPRFARAASNRAVVLNSLGRTEEALASAEQALALDPAFAEAHGVRANILAARYQYADARASYAEAIARDPANPELLWNASLLHLLMGEYELGWQRFEARWAQPLFKPSIRTFLVPLWLGDVPLAGKTLLIHPEQGFGDMIQFCRYVPQLEAMGAQVVLEAKPPLVALMRSLSSTVTVVPFGSALPPIDFHCPLMSLPHACRTTLATIPTPNGYLQVPAEARARWAEAFGPEPAPRIGLVWSGSPTHANDQNRSIPLSTFAPLFAGPYRFHALQKDPRPEDAPTLTHIVSHAGAIQDFSDTAALIAAMDLVISVDTSVAHLAGALGKPVWILLPYAPDYRWLLERGDSPWYSSVRLFRQPTPGDWGAVMAQVEAALSARFSNPAQ